VGFALSGCGVSYKACHHHGVSIGILNDAMGSRKNNFTFSHLSFSPSLADTSLSKASK